MKCMTLTGQARLLHSWCRLPVSLRAIIVGLVIALTAANVWPLLLLNLGAPLAAVTEALFLALYLWWASGRGPPISTQAAAPCRLPQSQAVTRAMGLGPGRRNRFRRHDSRRDRVAVPSRAFSSGRIQTGL